MTFSSARRGESSAFALTAAILPSMTALHELLLKLRQQKGLKSPRWPEGTHRVTDPRWCHWQRAAAERETGGPLCPTSFPVIPIPLHGADPSSVSYTTQNDREGQRVCSLIFAFQGKIPLFPALIIPSPASPSSLMEKEESR